MECPDTLDIESFKPHWVNDVRSFSNSIRRCTENSLSYAPSELSNGTLEPTYTSAETEHTIHQHAPSNFVENDKPQSYNDEELDSLWGNIDTGSLSSASPANHTVLDTTLSDPVIKVSGTVPQDDTEWDAEFDLFDLQSPPPSRRNSLQPPNVGISSISYDDPIENYLNIENPQLRDIPSERPKFQKVRRRPPSLDLSAAMSVAPYSIVSSNAHPPSTKFSDYSAFRKGYTTPPPSGDRSREQQSPDSAHRSHLIGRQRSVAKMPLTALYRLMGLSNNHELAKHREQEIIDEVMHLGFPVGEKAWFRDTDQVERRKILGILSKKFYEWRYSERVLEIIVRRGAYSRRQSNLRRGRRQRAALKRAAKRND